MYEGAWAQTEGSARKLWIHNREGDIPKRSDDLQRMSSGRRAGSGIPDHHAGGVVIDRWFLRRVNSCPVVGSRGWGDT